MRGQSRCVKITRNPLHVTYSDPILSSLLNVHLNVLSGNPITWLARRMRLPLGQQAGGEVQYTSSGKAYSQIEYLQAESRYQALFSKVESYTANLDSDMSLDAVFKAVGGSAYMTPYVQVIRTPLLKRTLWRNVK